MDIYCPAVPGKSVTPHLVEQHLARDNLAGVGAQIVQKIILLQGQDDFRFVAEYATTVALDADSPKLCPVEYRLGAKPRHFCPPQVRLYPCQQFTETKRFGHVVIGA